MGEMRWELLLQTTDLRFIMTMVILKNVFYTCTIEALTLNIYLKKHSFFRKLWSEKTEDKLLRL
jgi:hypothetical protein